MPTDQSAPRAADALFRRPWRFVTEAPSIAALPPAGPPEVAFAGRSNVGKSTLINVLTGTAGLARTSNTPGRTQALVFFVPDLPDMQPHAPPPLALVDMPGYGYAKAPKTAVESWTALIDAYLRGRATLKRVFILVDARHGLKPSDLAIMDELDRAAVSYQVVLTKVDKVKESDRASLEAATSEAIRRRGAAYPVVVAASSLKGQGIEALRAEIAGFARQ